VNLPISLNETVGADDLTGRNACPIWLRITALMQAIPFESDTPSEVAAKERVKSEGFTNSIAALKKMVIKKNSQTVWCYIEGVLYEFPSITLFYRMTNNTKSKTRTEVMHATATTRRAALKAIKEGKSYFVKGEYKIYLRNPNSFDIPILYLGG
jgi:hypothetical protein